MELRAVSLSDEKCEAFCPKSGPNGNRSLARDILFIRFVPFKLLT